MKKKFFRPCFALLLSMVLLFGGVRWDAAAIGDLSPFGAVLPPSAGSVTVSAPQSVIAKGEEMQLTYSATPSGGSITWSSSNTSVATVNSSGLVTAVAVGNVTITGRYVYNGTAYTDSVSLSVANIPVGLRNNTKYYLVNYSSGRLMGVANTSDANLTNVQTVSPTSNAWYQWTTELQSDGRFQLINEGSPTDKCLDVSDVNIDIYTQADRDCMKFTIQRVTSGDQAGLYLIKYGNNFVVEKSDHNVAIQSWYSPGCYWSFVKVNKSWAQLYGFEYERKVNGEASIYDSTDKFDEVATYLDNMGYIDIANVNLDTFLAYTFLQTDDMFIYAGHGEAGRISFCDEDPNQRIITGEIIKGTIIAHDNMNDTNTVFPNHHCINELPDNRLANARCVLYLACRSGNSYTSSHGTYNLVDETFNKGAHFVLGPTEKITDPHVDPWMEEFFASAEEGNSIEQCIEDADDAIGIITYNTDYGIGSCEGLPIYTRGDQTQYLNVVGG